MRFSRRVAAQPDRLADLVPGPASVARFADRPVVCQHPGPRPCPRRRAAEVCYRGWSHAPSARCRERANRARCPGRVRREGVKRRQRPRIAGCWQVCGARRPLFGVVSRTAVAPRLLSPGSGQPTGAIRRATPVFRRSRLDSAAFRRGRPSFGQCESALCPACGQIRRRVPAALRLLSDRDSSVFRRGRTRYAVFRAGPRRLSPSPSAPAHQQRRRFQPRLNHTNAPEAGCSQEGQPGHTGGGRVKIAMPIIASVHQENGTYRKLSTVQNTIA